MGAVFVLHLNCDNWTALGVLHINKPTDRGHILGPGASSRLNTDCELKKKNICSMAHEGGQKKLRNSHLYGDIVFLTLVTRGRSRRGGGEGGLPSLK